MKVCIVTGTRAEYGLFRPLLEKLKADPAFDLQLVATGMHLSPEFGLTYRDIEADGYHIDEKVEMLLSSDSAAGVTKSIGLGVIGFADALQRLRPDMLVLLGDRFETFAAATAALVARIPVAHLHGGELTEGAIDDSMRHSITKMSHIHFTSTEEYRRRVVQLGEDPSRVFTVGALGIDAIRGLRLLGRGALEKRLGIGLEKRNVLVTYHPVTLEKDSAEEQFGEILSALGGLKGTGIIFTKPNADTGGRVISGMIDRYVGEHPGRAVSFTSMGQLFYLSAMKAADAVVGNSSSGIIEAPYFGIPTVNIGDRQRGRIRAASVIDCEPEKNSIEAALKKAFSEGFRRACRHVGNPYGDGRTAERIVAVLRKLKLGRSLIMKRFYNIGLPAELLGPGRVGGHRVGTR